MDSASSIEYKKMFLRLRWMTIIITSYLILFSRGMAFPELIPSLLILFYLSSNLIPYFLPASYFFKRSFFCIVLLFDMMVVSLGIYITSQFDTDLYLVYFLIILFASIARNFKLLMINALVICGIYGWFLWTKGVNTKLFEEGILLRIPFIFILSMFYGFLIQSYEEKTKRIKTELKERKESEQRYRQIVESARDAVVILDKESRIKFFNRRFLQLTQYSSGDLLGMELNKMVDRFDIDETLKDSTQPLGSDAEPMILEMDVVRKEGEKRKVELSTSQFILPSGRTYTIVYLKDITDQKRMEERLIQSEKLSAIGEMSAGISHDLNNVLGAILGRVQLIKLEVIGKGSESGKNLDKNLLEELEIIEQAALDGAHTIKKIQEFSRPKTDESLFALLNVNDLIEGAVELGKTKIKDEAEEKGIPIKVHTVKSETCWVMGDQTELQEVFLNILLNSIDALPRGGTILLRARPLNGHVFIEVNDNGMGIPKSIRHRVFDPFFTTKGVQRSGLGLSISYGIIRRHHGEIQVETQEGVGTTFVIKLPMAKAGGLLEGEREDGGNIQAFD